MARHPDPSHYSNRVCPFLTQATASATERIERSLLAGVGGQPTGGPTRLPVANCIGPSCMLAVPAADQAGVIYDASCALTVSAINGFRQAEALERLAPLPKAALPG
jgi:hypothetical protein